MTEINFEDIIDAASEDILFGGDTDAEDLYLDPEIFRNLDDAEYPADDLFDDEDFE